MLLFFPFISIIHESTVRQCLFAIIGLKLELTLTLFDLEFESVNLEQERC